MAKFKITPTTTVAELKEQFRNEVGCVLRVYQRRSEAPDVATLVSLGAKEGELECRTSRTVGKFEEAFQNELNLKVKVYTKDNWVKVLDGITLAAAAQLPSGMTKAKMEEYLSYKRDEEGKENTDNVRTKKICIYLYGEGTRLDVFDKEGELSECHNAISDSIYFEINVKDGDSKTEYTYVDFGSQISSSAWPEEVYDEEERKFIDSNYTQFAGKEPGEVFEFEECDFYDAEEEGLGRIELFQTKINASVTIEISDDEKFDPKKLHFMYSEFVTPYEELGVNAGVIYDGKQYDIDIESEREISNDILWEA